MLSEKNDKDYCGVFYSQVRINRIVFGTRFVVNAVRVSNLTVRLNTKYSPITRNTLSFHAPSIPKNIADVNGSFLCLKMSIYNVHNLLRLLVYLYRSIMAECLKKSVHLRLIIFLTSSRCP